MLLARRPAPWRACRRRAAPAVRPSTRAISCVEAVGLDRLGHEAVDAGLRARPGGRPSTSEHDDRQRQAPALSRGSPRQARRVVMSGIRSSSSTIPYASPASTAASSMAERLVAHRPRCRSACPTGQLALEQAPGSWRCRPTASTRIPSSPGQPGLGRGARRRARRQRQGEPERAALALDALHADLPAHQLHELLGDGQPEPGAAVLARGGVVGLGERLEDPVLRGRVRCRCRCPCTSKRILGPPASGSAVTRAKTSPAAGELHRVGHQVGEHLATRACRRRTRSPAAPRRSTTAPPRPGPAPARPRRAHLLDQRRELERRLVELEPCPPRSSRSRGSRRSAPSARRRMSARRRRTRAAHPLSAVSSSRLLIPITPLSGVRISWLMFATNSDLRREASTARACAVRVDRSARRSSSMQAKVLLVHGLELSHLLGSLSFTRAGPRGARPDRRTGVRTGFDAHGRGGHADDLLGLGRPDRRIIGFWMYRRIAAAASRSGLTRPWPSGQKTTGTPASAPGPLAPGRAELVAVHLRHADVQHDQIRESAPGRSRTPSRPAEREQRRVPGVAEHESTGGRGSPGCPRCTRMVAGRSCARLRHGSSPTRGRRSIAGY